MARSRRIASLAVSVTANTTKFRKAMNDVSKRLERFSKRVAAASAAGFAAATVGMTAMVARSAAAIDRIAKLGRTFSVTIQEMATFEVIAGRSGVALETFARGARQLASVRFDALVKESKQAIQLFDELGISVQQLEQLETTPQLLAAVAKQLDAMPDSANKAALSMKLLGGRAAEMINAFVGGGVAIEQAAKDAERFGLVVRENLSSSVEEMRDQFENAKSPMIGFQRQLTGGLSPAFLLLGRIAEHALLQIFDQFGGVEAAAHKTALAIADMFILMGREADKFLEVIDSIQRFIEDPSKGMKRLAIRAGTAMIPGGLEKLQAFDTERRAMRGPGSLEHIALHMRDEVVRGIEEAARLAAETQRKSEQAAAVNPATRGPTAAHREEARLIESLRKLTEREEARREAAEANKPTKEDTLIELLREQNQLIRASNPGLT